MAALHGQADALRVLVAGGADLDAVCPFGTRVMHLAAMADGHPMLRALVALGWIQTASPRPIPQTSTP